MVYVRDLDSIEVKKDGLFVISLTCSLEYFWYCNVWVLPSISNDKNLVAQDIHEEDLNELQAAVRVEITPGSVIEVDPAIALKAATDTPPYALSIHATEQFLNKHYKKFKRKLE
jgi:hypothetical protein